MILALLFRTQEEAVVDKELISPSEVNPVKAVEEKRDEGLF